MSQLNEMMKLKEQEMLKEHSTLLENYSAFTEGIKAGYQAVHNKSIPNNVLLTTVSCLDNLTEQMHRMDEAQRSYNFGNFADYGYQLISAVIPNLVTNEIASIQPLKLRVGQVWYMSFKYTNPDAAGNLRGRGNQFGTSETIFDAQTGPSKKAGFTTENVQQELVGTAGSGSITTFSTTVTPSGTVQAATKLTYQPLRAGTVTITIGNFVGTDATPADLTAPPTTGAITGGDGLGNTLTGTINYSTGDFTVIASIAVGNAAQCLVDYNYIYEDNPNNIPQVDINITYQTLTAVEHKIRARYSLDSAYDLQQTYGVDAQETLVSTMTALVRSDIDKICMNQIRDTVAPVTPTSSLATTPTKGQGQGAGVVTFDATVPQYISRSAHYETFLHTLTKASNLIYSKTQSVYGNFIIGGNNVSNILETLPGYEGVTPDGSFSGPFVAGKFRNKWTFIKNPAYNDDEFVIGARGTNFLESGFVLAPYRALYVSPNIVLDDDVSRFGLFSSFARKMVNANFFAYGAIKNSTSM